jgi:glycine/D-amino acid oxidase-like deaminating enzyme
MSNAVWEESLPLPLTEPLGEQLDSTQHADIGIVGAGFTGLWTAYYLKQLDPSLRISIIDARHAGFGASGRNGGWASALFPAQLSALARATNRSEALRMHHAMTDNVDAMGRVIRKHNWEVGWSHGGTVVAARTPVQRDRAQADVRSMESWGLADDLLYLDRDAAQSRIGATDLLGGTFTPHCAAINPLQLVRSLAHHLRKSGVIFYENSPVTEIASGVIRTRNHSLRSPITIRATEGYTRTLRGHARTLAPVYSLMLATEPLSAEIWESIGLRNRETFSDYRNLIIYGQRTSDDRLAFGGRGAPYFFGSKITDSLDHNEKVHRELWRVLTDLFPVLDHTTVTHTWGGPLGIARDWWASCGFDPRTGMGFSGGYVGDGVGTSHLGGKTLAHLITGIESELTSLPWVNHHSRPWEIEPFRWLGTNLGLNIMQRADHYEDRTARVSKSAALMERLLGQ